MINTNLENSLNDLTEVVNLFGTVEDFNIRHRVTESEGKVVNTVTVNGTG